MECSTFEIRQPVLSRYERLRDNPVYAFFLQQRLLLKNVSDVQKTTDTPIFITHRVYLRIDKTYEARLSVEFDNGKREVSIKNLIRRKNVSLRELKWLEN